MKKEEVLDLLHFEKRLGNVWEWVPFFGPGEEIMKEKSFLEEHADKAYDSAIKDGFILFLIVVGFLVMINLSYRKSEVRNQAIGISLVIAALCFLYLGLQSPFLEIEAFKDDITVSISDISSSVEGRVYFLYQNKSVIDLIKFLFLGGNIFVGCCLFLFSIVFPLIKLISSFVVFLNPTSKYSLNATVVVEKLGKWSMADVFVSSIFLAYFSFANMSVGVETGASTLIGLYFFTAFVVFSIVSGAYLNKTVLRARRALAESQIN